MPAPTDTLWPLEAHSRAKHEILRRYVGAWIPIMASANRRILLVDGFAGPGRYLGGEPGSPLILLDSYLNHRSRAQIQSEIVYLFIEERQDRYEHLQSELAELELPENVTVHVVHGRYEDEFREGLKVLQEERKQIAPTLAFIDPFGYSDASMDLTGQFLQFAKCEVLLYMPLPFVARFVTRVGQDAAMTSLFGSDAWKGAGTLVGDERRQYLHDLFREQLRLSGSRYVRSFEIETHHGNGYHLFFGTSHTLGLARMKEAMWSVDPMSGSFFADTTRSDQLVLFTAAPDTTQLLVALRSRFATQSFTIEEAATFTLIETPFVPSMHLKKRTLVPEEAAGRLQVLTPRARVGTFPPGTRMKFSE